MKRIKQFCHDLGQCKVHHLDNFMNYKSAGAGCHFLLQGFPFSPLKIVIFSSRNLPNPGIEPTPPVSPAMLADSLLLSHQGSQTKIMSDSCLVMSTLQPMDCSPPGFSGHGTLQARILEWVAIPFSRGSSRPRDPTWVFHVAGRFFILSEPPGKPQLLSPNNSPRKYVSRSLVAGQGPLISPSLQGR